MLDFKKSKIYKAIFLERFFKPKFLRFLKWLSFVGFILFLFFYIFWSPFSFAEEKNLGISFIFFFVWGTLLIFLGFFNQRIKNPKIKGKAEENLVNFLDLLSVKVILKALSFKKYSFNLSLFLLMVTMADFNFTFRRFSLTQEKVYNAAEEIWKKEGIDKKDSFKDAEITIINAFNIATSLGKEKISVFHLLAAIAESDLLVGKVLSKIEIAKEDIIETVLWQERILDQKEKKKKFWAKYNLLRKTPIARDWTSGYTPFLDMYAREITDVVKETPRSGFVLHKKELANLEDSLVRQGDNCAVLVGEPGVGKRTMLFNLANRILEEKSYKSLNFNRILELNMQSLLAASQSIEEVEINFQTIFNEATRAGNIILVIKDIHEYFGLQKDAESVIKTDISGILSEYITYPTFRVVGTATSQGYHNAMNQASQIMGRLSKIEIPPALKKETLMVLEEAVLPLEKEVKLLISFPAIKEILNLADRYIGDVPFPKKAIDLLNDVILYKIRRGIPGKVILPDDVIGLVSEKTEIPVGETKDEEKEILLNLEEIIHERLINQEEAVSEIANALRRARADISQKKKTMGNFLFLGPTGVGKTETAKCLARAYFGNEKRMIRLDMSEYQDIDSLNRLIGSETTSGHFTTMVREDPFSLILLDEIEKAHPNILNLFLQILDEGHVTDGAGRMVDFKNTIIIATSNAGAELIRTAINEEKNLQEYKEEFINEILKQGIFRPEFLNRFDAVVLFRTLTKENLIKIAEIMLGDIKEGLSAKEIDFIITSELREKIAELGFNPEFGAREMKRVLQDKVENNIAKVILAGKIKAGDSVEMNAETFEIKLVEK